MFFGIYIGSVQNYPFIFPSQIENHIPTTEALKITSLMYHHQ